MMKKRGWLSLGLVFCFWQLGFCDGFRITTESLPDGKVGEEYYYEITTTGGVEPLEWSTEGTLPPGLYLSPSYAAPSAYLITPQGEKLTQAGTFTFKIKVKDSSSPPATAEKEFTLKVVGSSPPPQPQPYSVSGKVIEDATGQEMSGIVVYLNVGTITIGSALTNSKGEYQIRINGETAEAYKNREAKLFVPDSSNCASAEKTVTIIPGKNDVVDFVLIWKGPHTIRGVVAVDFNRKGILRKALNGVRVKLTIGGVVIAETKTKTMFWPDDIGADGPGRYYITLDKNIVEKYRGQEAIISTDLAGYLSKPNPVEQKIIIRFRGRDRIDFTVEGYYYRVEGKVVDKETGKPLEGIRVELKSPGYSCSTITVIGGPRPGTYAITISGKIPPCDGEEVEIVVDDEEGYYPQTKKVKVRHLAGNTPVDVVNFELEKKHSQVSQTVEVSGLLRAMLRDGRGENIHIQLEGLKIVFEAVDNPAERYEAEVGMIGDYFMYKLEVLRNKKYRVDLIPPLDLADVEFVAEIGCDVTNHGPGFEGVCGVEWLEEDWRFPFTLDILEYLQCVGNDVDVVSLHIWAVGESSKREVEVSGLLRAMIGDGVGKNIHFQLEGMKIVFEAVDNPAERYEAEFGVISNYKMAYNLKVLGNKKYRVDLIPPSDLADGEFTLEFGCDVTNHGPGFEGVCGVEWLEEDWRFPFTLDIPEYLQCVGNDVDVDVVSLHIWGIGESSKLQIKLIEAGTGQVIDPAGFTFTISHSKFYALIENHPVFDNVFVVKGEEPYLQNERVVTEFIPVWHSLYQKEPFTFKVEPPEGSEYLPREIEVSLGQVKKEVYEVVIALKREGSDTPLTAQMKIKVSPEDIPCEVILKHKGTNRQFKSSFVHEGNFEKLPVGEYVLLIRADGYQDIVENIWLSSDLEITQMLQIQPSEEATLKPDEACLITDQETGVEIKAEAGTVSKEVEICIEKIEDGIITDAIELYEFEAFEKETGQKVEEFKKFLTISLVYDDTGIDEESLCVVTSSDLITWTEVSDVVVKPAENKVIIRINHFSYYAIRAPEITPIVNEMKLPEKNALFSSYPNPAGATTWIPYQIKRQSVVTVRIYNVLGQLVRTLNLGNQAPRYYLSKSDAILWDGKDARGEKLPTGVYLYELVVDNKVIGKQQILLLR
jgi:hypothetical protein